MSTVLGPPVVMSDNVVINIAINVMLVVAILFVFGLYPFIKMMAKRNKSKKTNHDNK